MATLLEDIQKQSRWLEKAFFADHLKLDYSIKSLQTIDKFFDMHSKDGKAIPGGRLSENLGGIIFSIGAYIGETLIRNSSGGAWQTDDNDPAGDSNAAVHLSDGTICWPMQRAAKRLHFGSQESIYVYGMSIVPHPMQRKKPKSWWQFWK